MTNLAKNRFSKFCAKFAIFIKLAFFKCRFAIPFVLKIPLWRIFAIFAIFVRIATLKGALCHLSRIFADFGEFLAIFVKLAIMVKIATLDGAPLPYHLTSS